MQRASGRQIKFKPFFDAGSVITQLFIALGAGLVFMIALNYGAKAQFQNSILWMLSPLIAVLIVSNNIGIHYMRHMLNEMEVRISSKRARELQKKLQKSGSHIRYAMVAIIFALFYGGLSLQIPSIATGGLYQSLVLTLSFMTIGFFAGIAIHSIFLVHRVIRVFLKDNIYVFDYNAPGKCGGSQFLGNSLLIFSALALLNGMLFSIFLFHFNFGKNPTPILLFIKYFWIVLPYLLSIIALIGPALPIHQALRLYKVNEEENFIKLIGEIKNSLKRRNISWGKKESLQSSYTFYHEKWDELSRMSTWPFHLQTKLKYLAIFSSSTVASYLEYGKKILHTFLPDFFP